MRELKFRGWDKKEWRMLEFDLGDLVYQSDTGSINIKDWDDIVRFEDLEWMQYTGLKDKNGKEVYDGDILRLYFDVDKIQDWLWLQLTDKQKKDGYLDREVTIPDFYQNALPDKVEVIGNIYENPELLKLNTH